MGTDDLEDIYTYTGPFLCLSVVLCNIIAIISLIRKIKRQRASGRGVNTVAHIYLLNLAISDVLVGIMLPSLAIIDEEDYPDLYSIIRLLFLRLSLFASIFNLLALSLDRKMAVASPLKYKQKKSVRGSAIICLCTWLLAFSMCGVLYASIKYEWIVDERHSNIIYIVAFILPMISYIVIAVQTAMKIRLHRVQLTSMAAASSSTGSILAVTHLVAKLVVAFMLCWGPMITDLFLFTVGAVEISSLRRNFFLFAAVFNSTVNPLLYLQPIKSIQDYMKRYKKTHKRRPAVYNRKTAEDEKNKSNNNEGKININFKDDDIA